MKKLLKIILSIVLLLIVLGIVFCIIDSLRVHADEEPIFAFVKSIADGEDYSAHINIGLGYKIIRYEIPNQPDQIKIGTIFMKVGKPNIVENNTQESNSGEVVILVESGESGESGEKIVKITTFGENYTDKIMLEGM